MMDFEYKAAVVEVSHMLSQRGYVGTFEGNISYRDGQRIFMTPTTQNKETLTEGKIICIDMDGKQLEGDLKKTSEYILHTEIYKMRPDVQAVVHCHAPFSTAWALAGETYESKCATEGIMQFGKVPCCRYGTPGTKEILGNLSEYVIDYDTVFLENHGVVSYAKDPLTAFAKINSLENLLKTEFIRHLMFPHIDNSLPEEEVKRLNEMGRKWHGYHEK